MPKELNPKAGLLFLLLFDLFLKSLFSLPQGE